MSTRRLLAGFVLFMAALAGTYYLLPSWHMVLWTAIGVTSAVAIAVGVARHRPRRRAPWLLLAAAVFAFMMGDTTYLFLTDVLGQPQPFPSLADVIYLGVFFPLTGAGLLGLARSGAASRDRAGLLDALTLTVGVGLLTWLFLIDPYVRSPDLTPWQKAISVAYPLYGVLVMAIVARMVLAVRMSPSVLLLAAGVVGMFVADVLYGLNRLGGAWSMGGPVDIGWIVFYAAWGLAALHPSMVKLTEPRALRHPGLNRRRLVLVALSTLIPPIVLVTEAASGSARDVGVAAGASAILFLLVLARLYGAMNVYRAGVARERGLREAAAAMVSATHPDEVATAVRAATAHLLPAGTPHQALLALGEQADPPPAEGVSVGYARVLAPRLAAQLNGHEVVALCPLLLHHRVVGDPHIGTLVLAAHESALVNIQESIEVLASQAALALERIALSREINRRNSEEYFRTLVHNTADVILIVNGDDRIRYASPSASAVLGPGELIGVPLYDLVDPEYRPTARRMLDLVRAREHRGGVPDDWVVLGAGDGGTQVEVTCRDLRHEPTVDGLVVTLRDVTERRRLERELTHRAFHDSLTGLANRVLFQDRVREALSRAGRNGTLVGVLFIDLDDFKVVNDTIGHAAGDDLLIAVSKRLTTVLRSWDTAARLGGDEFAALIEDTRDPHDIEEIAQRIVDAFAEPFVIGDHQVNGAASVGVSTTADAQGDEELMRQADLALYVAKGEGKGRWRRYQAALHAAVLRRLELRAELDQAVVDQAFTLEYQPIVALNSGRPAGLEALLRWNHPTRGTVRPGDFIDVAEDSGLVVPIGSWVLGRALHDAAAWCAALPAEEPPYVSINVSVRQFRDPAFLDTVLGELASTGLPPRLLVLEITESLLLRDDEKVWADLAALRDVGVRVAIDDFGTGYSSLSYLRHVPADLLKIEKSFIDTISVSARQRALVEGILRLAHTLGLSVVAEGIEKPVDRDVLAAIGCPYGQGFLFCRPLRYPAALRWLQDTKVAA